MMFIMYCHTTFFSLKFLINHYNGRDYIFVVVVLAVIVGLDSFSVIPILYSMMTKLVGDQDQGEFL